MAELRIERVIRVLAAAEVSVELGKRMIAKGDCMRISMRGLEFCVVEQRVRATW